MKGLHMKTIFHALQDIAALIALTLFAAAIYFGSEVAATAIVAGRIAQ